MIWICLVLVIVLGMLCVTYNTCWHGAEARARKYRHQRDVLYKNIGISLWEPGPKDWEDVLSTIDEELKK